jgi:hypothetical protein
MLSDFYMAIHNFAKLLSECNKALASWKSLDFIQSSKMFSLGQDIENLSDFFVNTHINATMWVIDEMNETKKAASLILPEHGHFIDYLSGKPDIPNNQKEAIERYIESSQSSIQRMILRDQSPAGAHSKKSAAQLKVAYKSYFLFIRAFHDACYGVLLNLHSQRPGKYSSMNDCIKNEKSLVHDKIITIPNYVEWFKSFREKRDIIKLGVDFSLCGPENDVGISFVKATAERGIVVDVSENGNKCRIGDLVTAINFSSILLSVIKNNIPINE